MLPFDKQRLLADRREHRHADEIPFGRCANIDQLRCRVGGEHLPSFPATNIARIAHQTNLSRARPLPADALLHQDALNEARNMGRLHGSPPPRRGAGEDLAALRKRIALEAIPSGKGKPLSDKRVAGMFQAYPLVWAERIPSAPRLPF